MLDYCTLGCGGTMPLKDRALASLYLRVNGRALVVDCGEGTQIQIQKLGWGMQCIDALLLTHFHADHCSGLPGLLLALAKALRTEPLHIWGPVGLNQVVGSLRVIAPQLPYEVVLHELPRQGGSFRAIGLEIEAFALNHGIPCLGYHFALRRQPAFQPELARALEVPVRCWSLLQKGETVLLPDGRSVSPEAVLGAPRRGLRLLYATDTRPVEAISAYGRGVDLMILEGMYGPEEKRELALKNHHMLFSESAALALAAQPRRLLLTHFSPSLEEPEAFLPLARAVFPDTWLAEDVGTGTLRFDR